MGTPFALVVRAAARNWKFEHLKDPRRLRIRARELDHINDDFLVLINSGESPVEKKQRKNDNNFAAEKQPTLQITPTRQNSIILSYVSIAEFVDSQSILD
jgi:hypothetical protein